MKAEVVYKLTECEVVFAIRDYIIKKSGKDVIGKMKLEYYHGDSIKPVTFTEVRLIEDIEIP